MYCTLPSHKCRTACVVLPFCPPPPPPFLPAAVPTPAASLPVLLLLAPCLSLSFDHPNLVRSLHYARIRINPNSAEASLVRCVCASRVMQQTHTMYIRYDTDCIEPLLHMLTAIILRMG